MSLKPRSLFRGERIKLEHSNVLDKGLEAVAETLVDRRSFVLSTKQYDVFVATLDVAPKYRPRLERLFVESSVLE